MFKFKPLFEDELLGQFSLQLHTACENKDPKLRDFRADIIVSVGRTFMKGVWLEESQVFSIKLELGSTLFYIRKEKGKYQGCIRKGDSALRNRFYPSPNVSLPKLIELMVEIENSDGPLEDYLSKYLNWLGGGKRTYRNQPLFRRLK